MLILMSVNESLTEFPFLYYCISAGIPLWNIGSAVSIAVGSWVPGLVDRLWKNLLIKCHSGCEPISLWCQLESRYYCVIRVNEEQARVVLWRTSSAELGNPIIWFLMVWGTCIHRTLCLVDYLHNFPTLCDGGRMISSRCRQGLTLWMMENVLAFAFLEPG